jgi:hypothetical protein
MDPKTQGRVARLEAELDFERRRRRAAEDRLDEVSDDLEASRDAASDAEAAPPERLPGNGPPGAPGSPQRRAEALRRREEVLDDMPDLPETGVRSPDESHRGAWGWQRRYPPSTTPPPKA